VTIGLVLVGVIALASSPVRAVLNPGDTLYNPDVTYPGTPLFVEGLPSWYDGFNNAEFHLNSNVTGDYTGTVDNAVFYLNGSDPLEGLGFAYQVHLITIPGEAITLEEIDFSNPGEVWKNVRIGNVGADGSGDSTEAIGGDYTWDDGAPLHISREGVRVAMVTSDSISSPRDFPRGITAPISKELGVTSRPSSGTRRRISGVGCWERFTCKTAAVVMPRWS